MGSGFNKKKHKYFIVSDIHGNYDELLSSLEEKKFDPKNPKHILISLGDAIDRGPKNKEVITFLNNLSHKILIRGNHEDLFQDLINRNGIPLPNDISNKTIETFLELHNLEIKDLDLIIEGKMTLPKINEEWIKYNKSCIDYYETNQYIFVHGWIPINEDKSYNKNWRKCNKNDWDNARWINGFEMSKNKIFCPGKTIVCGHVQSNFWHKEFENCEIDNFEPYISDNVIAIDACTQISHFVNVVVLED